MGADRPNSFAGNIVGAISCRWPHIDGLLDMSPINRQWRSLEELADDPSFVARAAQEFPLLADAMAVPSDRRRVLKLMAAALAMSGLGGCDLGEPGGHLDSRSAYTAEHHSRAAELLQHRQRRGWLRRRDDRQASDGSPDQSGGQSATSGEPRRHRCIRAGAVAGILRSGARRRDHGTRAAGRLAIVADRNVERSAARSPRTTALDCAS